MTFNICNNSSSDEKSYDKIIIAMLDFGIQNIKNAKTITKQEMKNHLSESFDINKVDLIVELYWHENFKFKDDKGTDTQHILSSTGYFRYLQHKAMRNTRWYSLIAWLLSIFSIFVAVVAIFHSSNNVSDINVQSIDSTLKKEILIYPIKADSILNVIYLKIDTIKEYSDTMSEKLDFISNEQGLKASAK